MVVEPVGVADRVLAGDAVTLRRSPARTEKLRARAEELAALGDPAAADRLRAKLGKKPTKLRAIRKGSSRKGWQAMRQRVIREQGGTCAMGGHPAFRLDLCHLEPLRMGGSRHDETNPRNERESLVALCRRHHEELDAMTGEARAELVARFRMAIELAGKGGHGTRRGL